MVTSFQDFLFSKYKIFFWLILDYFATKSIKSYVRVIWNYRHDNPRIRYFFW
jgi:hypothetical protein